MSKRCYYDVLGVGRTCSPDDIKSAYRKLAKELHPDRNQGDNECEHRFKEVNEAYEVLKDGNKRATYDRFGHAAFENGGRGGPQGFDFASSFTDVFDDLFGEFMGGGRRPRHQNRGSDLRYDLQISLEDAYHGKTAHIELPMLALCEVCGGSGAAGGSKPETCQTCSGAGKVRAQQGFFTIERTCPACRGQGRIIRQPCSGCSGHGRVQQQRSLSVDIPKGVEEGTRIRLPGEGQPGSDGGPAGDLYIFLTVEPHPIFQRDGHDLHIQVPVGLCTAALGGTVTIPALDGSRVKITVPEGAQTGQHIRVRGKGMPALKGVGHYGDLHVELRVETPVKLSRKQKDLLRTFAEDSKGTQPETDSFFAKLKDWASGI